MVCLACFLLLIILVMLFWPPINEGFESSHKKIAAYNGFDFHYEMYGYILDYCKSRNYSLTIYSDNKNNLGYIDFYKSLFDFDLQSISQFQEDRYDYDVIFLLTDNDDSFPTEDAKINRKTICIDHLHEIRNTAFETHVSTRPFAKERPWALPTFPILTSGEKMENMRDKEEDIIVFLGHTPNAHNKDVLQRIVSTRTIRLMVISRNNESSITGLPYPVEYYSDLSTEELINILLRASYVITDITNHKDYTHELLSGSIPLAFSTLTPLIMSKATNEYYKFKNVIEFDSTAKEEDIVLKDMDIVALEKERGDLISRNYELFDKIVLGT